MRLLRAFSSRSVIDLANAAILLRRALFTQGIDRTVNRLHRTNNERRFEFYAVSQKKQNTKLLPITSPSINQFSNFLTGELSRKCATSSCLNIPLRLKHVATLSCKI